MSKRVGKYGQVKPCGGCGHPFVVTKDRARFCSRACLARPDVEAVCGNCGKSFVVKPGAKGQYCSRECACQVTGRNGAARSRGMLITRTCDWCKREYQGHRSRVGRFCSRKCAGCARQDVPFDGGGGGVDNNQGEIVKALRQIGATVLITNRVGRGFPDLVVGFRNRNVLMEVKNGANSYGRKGFNKNQQQFHDQWRGEPPVIVRSIDDALNVIHDFSEALEILTSPANP